VDGDTKAYEPEQIKNIARKSCGRDAPRMVSDLASPVFTRDDPVDGFGLRHPGKRRRSSSFSQTTERQIDNGQKHNA
jgi:hypothetical protein